MARTLLRGLLFACMTAAPWLAATASGDETMQSEYRIKAAFLYNFARFTSWPVREDTRFNLCILGESPFNGELDDLVGKQVHDLPLQVSYPVTAASARHCHLVFISRSHEENLEETLAALGYNAILSVSDIGDFIDKGGIIGLRTIDSKVRFEINIDAAAGAGISISSKLLSLATTIRSGN